LNVLEGRVCDNWAEFGGGTFPGLFEYTDKFSRRTRSGFGLIGWTFAVLFSDGQPCSRRSKPRSSPSLSEPVPSLQSPVTLPPRFTPRPQTCPHEIAGTAHPRLGQCLCRPRGVVARLPRPLPCFSKQGMRGFASKCRNCQSALIASARRSRPIRPRA
jgi:hypothetical protein